MAWVRRVRTASGATAVEIAESVAGRRRIVRHLGSAHDEGELGLLVEEAHRLLADDEQGVLDLGITAPVPKVRLLPAAALSAPQAELFADGDDPAERPRARQPVARARVLKTSSRLLYDTLASVYAGLGFDEVGDEVFRDLVIARVVEPTSLLDVDRVLADLGRVSASHSTRKRTLRRAQVGTYRDQIATACFHHAVTNGDVSLCLYDVTTLYFEAEKEDDLRKVGFSKERRVDPQIVVGLLVDRHGFPLEIGCFEGNKAETATIVPIIKDFQARHDLADMVVVADAGMLSAGNLEAFEEAGLRFIVGSRATKAPTDLESHFRWHGDAFEGGQVIDTITPKTSRAPNKGIENNTQVKAEPLWDPHEHPASWRAVWAYSTKRAVRDNKTLTLQENRAREVVEGEKSARTPRFVKTSHGAKSFDEASLARARRVVGLKGYVTNIPAEQMDAGEVIASYHDLWAVEQSFRMSKTDLRARPMFARTRDAIEAHLTIVFTALAVSREVQNRTGLSLRRVLRTLRPLRSATVEINGITTTIPPNAAPKTTPSSTPSEAGPRGTKPLDPTQVGRLAGRWTGVRRVPPPVGARGVDRGAPGVGHPALLFESRYECDVSLGPAALGASRGDAHGVAVLVAFAGLAVDPAEAEQFLDRARPGDRGVRDALLGQHQPHAGRRRLVLFEPRSQRGRVGHEQLGQQGCHGLTLAADADTCAS